MKRQTNKTPEALGKSNGTQLGREQAKKTVLDFVKGAAAKVIPAIMFFEEEQIAPTSKKNEVKVFQIKLNFRRCGQE